jgi:cysteine desulfurase family protein
MSKCIYLNNAATGFPKPDPVLKAVEAVLKEPPVHQARTGFEGGATDIVRHSRTRLASLFNVSVPERIVFTSGSTESLNLALYGLAIEGKQVVTTSVEHNSVLRPLKTMESEGRITLAIVDCDENGFIDPGGIETAIKPNTGAVVVNHCSNVTGVVNDIGAIGKIAKDKGIPFIVDASQSAGVYPIDVQEMDIDILAFTGHKSLHGLQGTGGIYIKEDIALRPLKVGGTGVRSDYLLQPEEIPMKYEAGTQNLPGITSLSEGVKYIQERGLDTIRAKKEDTILEIRRRLSRNDRIVFYPSEACKQQTTIFSFTVKGLDPADIGYILENNFGIVIRSGLHCAPLIHRHAGTFPDGSVRVSPSVFTTANEIDTFCSAMDQILQMA